MNFQNTKSISPHHFIYSPNDLIRYISRFSAITQWLYQTSLCYSEPMNHWYTPLSDSPVF